MASNSSGVGVPVADHTVLAIDCEYSLNHGLPPKTNLEKLYSAMDIKSCRKPSSRKLPIGSSHRRQLYNS
jgi:hypothetical protein